MKDGGQAFPCKEPKIFYPTELEDNLEDIKRIDVDGKGMTLRDYFASCALGGMCANQGYCITDLEKAKWAYKLADAMLEQRGKEISQPKEVGDE